MRAAEFRVKDNLVASVAPVATSYDKTDTSYAATIHLAAAIIASR